MIRSSNSSPLALKMGSSGFGVGDFDGVDGLEAL
jgi:hypothetical protein